MTTEDFSVFKQVWCMTCTAVGATAPDLETLYMIFDDLMEYSIEQVLAALKNHRKTSQFMPKPADVINFIKNNDTTAAESWALVDWAIMNFGPRAVCFEDPRIAITLNKMGGYFYLINNLTDKNEDFYRKEFIEMFNNVIPEHYPAEMKACLNGTEPVIAYVSAAKQAYAYKQTKEVLNELQNGAAKISPPPSADYKVLEYRPKIPQMDPEFVAEKRRELETIRDNGGDWVMACLGMMKVKK
jgi:hypothetical protein